MTRSRIITISNRLPFSVKKTPSSDDTTGNDATATTTATLQFKPSVGGLATGLASLETVDMQWIGWPGMAEEDMDASDHAQIAEYTSQHHCTPVSLTQQHVDEFYLGFSNETIWPLFHYFFHHCQFNPDHYATYQRVNQLFADAAIAEYQPGDRFWIHDYQLLLVPQLIRDALPDATIGFFLHIPFPSFEIMRLLPWRQELVQGLLGSDLIGFHTYDYVRHFLSSVYRITGCPNALSKISVHDGRTVTVDAFPMGINYDRFAQAIQLEETVSAVADLKSQFRDDVRVILSVDRLDYTKGILERLHSFDVFLNTYPEYKRKVALVVVAVPSREAVDTYVTMREELERTTSRINGTHGGIDWTPIRYLYRGIPFHELSALYRYSDVALITPLRDGMNLVAKEYVAAQDPEDPGVLVLSEMAGAAHEMYEAVMVNPFDTQGVAAGIQTALEMPKPQRKLKNAVLQQRLKRYSVQKWAADFLESLETHQPDDDDDPMRELDTTVRKDFCDRYASSSQRLFLLNYDGTLVKFYRNPADAKPTETKLELLRNLCADPSNTVVVLSGRRRETLGEWFGHIPHLHLVAEHGAYIRRAHAASPNDCEWKVQYEIRDEWKDTIRPVMDRFMDRTPGSYVEEKATSLVWDCRGTDPEMAMTRKRTLTDTLSTMTSNLEIGVVETLKSIEVRPIGISKGTAAETFVKEAAYDFICFASDDHQQDVLPVLPDDQDYCFTFRVGKQDIMSAAKYYVANPTKLRKLLQSLLTTQSK